MPALADFLPMVKGQGSMALAGSPLVKAVTGEDISNEDLGGSKVHSRKSGVADMECDLVQQRCTAYDRQASLANLSDRMKRGRNEPLAGAASPVSA